MKTPGFAILLVMGLVLGALDPVFGSQSAPCEPASGDYEIQQQRLNEFWKAVVRLCITDAGGSRYHPSSQTVYLDLKQISSSRFTRNIAKGHPILSWYVLAHEWGHHAQKRWIDAATPALLRENQADCLAGYFLGHLGLTRQEGFQAVLAAVNIGDLWWHPDQNHGGPEARGDAILRGLSGANSRPRGFAGPPNVLKTPWRSCDIKYFQPARPRNVLEQLQKLPYCYRNWCDE